MKRIYKYCHEDRIDILKNGRIRFTQPINFNDPFEFQPSHQPLFNPQQILHGVQPVWNDIDKQEIKKNTMVPLKSKLEAEWISKLKQNYGVLCLIEENEDSLLMWSHYANGHKGFVIEFDRNHDFFKKNAEQSGLEKVEYSEERPAVSIHDFERSIQFYLRKSTDWKYENELRMVKKIEDHNEKITVNNEDIYLFEIPLDCITGIILGYKMQEEMRQKFIILLKGDKKYEHIRLRQAEIHDSAFRLVFNDI